jgi:hypothetical protein
VTLSALQARVKLEGYLETLNLGHTVACSCLKIVIGYVNSLIAEIVSESKAVELIKVKNQQIHGLTANMSLTHLIRQEDFHGDFHKVCPHDEDSQLVNFPVMIT